ncbi:MAG: class I SAM-dependent methyltransferase [Ilumatobacteraceae bacterium]
MASEPDSFDPSRIGAAYDAMAAAYAAAHGDELDQLAMDARLVDRLGRATDGPILEVGAGVAPVARRLGSRVVAADLSRAMLGWAPVSTPRVQADARRLPFSSGAFGGAVLRDVLRHVPRATTSPRLLAEVRRVLVPGRSVLVAVHLGTGSVEFSELLGVTFEPISGAFHGADELDALLRSTGFEPVAAAERGPAHSARARHADATSSPARSPLTLRRLVARAPLGER